MTNWIDRRRFLTGAGGAMLALPMLEAFAPRRAFAQAAPSPKRLIIFANEHGRCIGDGVEFDLWSPGATSRALSSANMGPSPQLAPLAAILDKVVTFDGIDDVIRHATGNGDGHAAPSADAFTCRMPLGELGVDCTCNLTAGGPSIDFVAGTRLRANAAQYPSILFPLSCTEYPNDVFYTDGRFWTDTATHPFQVSSIPRNAIDTLFANVISPMMPPPPQPALKDRLIARRTSILDSVTAALTSLKGRVNARDRMQLDHHADYIRTIEQRQMPMMNPPPIGAACRPPDKNAAPEVHPANYDEWQTMGGNPVWEDGSSDDQTMPYTIENLVQALACDVTRVAVLSAGVDNTFAFQYPTGSNPVLANGGWHTSIHSIPHPPCASGGNCSDPNTVDAVVRGYQWFTQVFVRLVQSLEAVVEPDGSTLLDNTLVVWMSELGHGSVHSNFNIPVVLAGLGNTFAKGRHIVENRRTLGDLHAHILRLLGTGNDMTFGETGTVGELATRFGVSTSRLIEDAGYPGYISTSTPLHGGPLSL